MSVHVDVYMCIHTCMCVGVLNVNVYLWGCLRSGNHKEARQ